MASDVCNSKIRRGGTLSPNPSPLMERGTDPIEMIAEGKMSLSDIARSSGMSIIELAEHVCTPRNLEALDRVKLLHATQHEILLGQLKRKALLRLAELTDEVPAGSADEIRASEVMRKACADLLRYGGLNTEKCPSGHGKPGGGGPRSRSYHRDSITPATEAEVLEALERLGREDEDEDEEVYPQIEDSPACPPGRGRMRSREYENGYEPRAPGEPQGPPRRTSGSVEHGEAGCFNENARDDGHRVSLSPSPHGQAPKTPLAHATRHTSRMPLPLYIRSTKNRIANYSTRTLPDDAHPP